MNERESERKGNKKISVIKEFKNSTQTMAYASSFSRALTWWRVFSDDPAPLIDGIRINSPHYLCKIILKPTSARKYTLVVSQYEKMKTIFYTLRAYATCPFTLKRIVNVYQHTRQVTSRCVLRWLVLRLSAKFSCLKTVAKLYVFSQRNASLFRYIATVTHSTVHWFSVFALALADLKPDGAKHSQK